MNKRKVIGFAVLVLIFLVGVTGGYFYFSRVMPKEKLAPGETAGSEKTEDLLVLRMYYRVGNQLQIEERKHPRKTRQIEIAEGTVSEYLRGPATTVASDIPKDVKILGLYKGGDGILYVDLSDEFRRNFQGDVLAEFFLLKGLYESIISNVEDIQDVKILIEGKEVETLGGHFYLIYPLKDTVSYEYR